MAQTLKLSRLPALRTTRAVGSPGRVGGDSSAFPRPSIVTLSVGQVVVLGVTGPLCDVVEDLDRAIRLALAQGPRGVACDLSGVVKVGAPGALRALASAGRHPRVWPGVPVAVSCLGPRAGETLRRKPLGGYLVVTASVRQALSAVLRARCPSVVSLRLTPHPTAPRAARDFVSRTLLDWRLSQRSPEACVVVSELVTNAMIHAGTDIDLTLSEHRRSVRVAVRDRSHDLPVERHYGLDAPGRGLAIVAELSSGWGVLPRTDGGKVVWAVLDASPGQSG